MENSKIAAIAKRSVEKEEKRGRRGEVKVFFREKWV